MGAGAITEFFIDLLNELDEMGEGRSIKDKFDLICATMACHGSIRANQPMEHDKIYSLLKSLDEAENPHFCPHGRPVAKLLDFRELEKMFGRI